MKELKGDVAASVSGEETEPEKTLSMTQESLHLLIKEMNITEDSEVEIKKLAKDIAVLAALDYSTMKRRCLNKEMIPCFKG